MDDLDALGLLSRPAKPPTRKPLRLEEQASRLRREPPGPLKDALREAVSTGVQAELVREALNDNEED